MRDKYNLNTLPAGAVGIDDHEIGKETKFQSILFKRKRVKFKRIKVK